MLTDRKFAAVSSSEEESDLLPLCSAGAAIIMRNEDRGIVLLRLIAIAVCYMRVFALLMSKLSY